MTALVSAKDLKQVLSVFAHAYSEKQEYVEIKAQKKQQTLAFSMVVDSLFVFATVGARVDGDGGGLFHCSMLSELVACIKDDAEVELVFEESSLRLKSTSLSASFRKRVGSIHKQSVGGDVLCVLRAVKFRKLLDSVKVSSEKDGARLMLHSVRIFARDGVLCMLACDGYRLSFCEMRDVTLEGQLDITISLNAIEKLLKIFSRAQAISVLACENAKEVTFATDDGVSVTVSGLGGVYPDALSLLNAVNSYEVVVVSALELRKACAAARVFAKDKALLLSLELRDSGEVVMVSSEDKEKGSATSEVIVKERVALHKSDDVFVYVSARMMKEVMYAVSTKSVELLIRDVHSAVMVREDIGHAKLTHLVMPVVKD